MVVRSGPYASNKIGVGESETMEMAVMRRKVEASRGATEGVFFAAPPRIVDVSALAAPPRRKSVLAREQWRPPVTPLAGDAVSLSARRPGLLAPADEHSTAAARRTRAIVEPISPIASIALVPVK